MARTQISLWIKLAVIGFHVHHLKERTCNQMINTRWFTKRTASSHMINTKWLSQHSPNPSNRNHSTVGCRLMTALAETPTAIIRPTAPLLCPTAVTIVASTTIDKAMAAIVIVTSILLCPTAVARHIRRGWRRWRRWGWRRRRGGITLWWFRTEYDRSRDPDIGDGELGIVQITLHIAWSRDPTCPL